VARIRLEDVTKRFGAVTAVDRMHLELQEGELVAFLGPSGCGKTTTLRMIAGFEQPTSGVISFGGDDVTHLAPERRNVGMVFQNYALFPHMTVEQNVAYGLEMRRVERREIAARVAAMLDKVQLGGLGSRYARQISGGQQQRTALARALVINPAVLLLDEPLANLDAKLREEMRFYIRELQREFDITTIYVTHDQAEALVLADRIAVMMDGVLHQIGAPRDIYERPASARVASFIGLTNLIEATVARNARGALTLATPWGEIAARGAPTRREGEAVLVSIRPESFTMTAAADSVTGVRRSGDATVVTAHVREMAYLGSIIDYRVETDDGLSLRAQSAGGEEYAPGEVVALQAPAAKAWVVDPGGPADPGDAVAEPIEA
jgi:putative spermidine/putrescine transport system ATP-binding protein